MTSRVLVDGGKDSYEDETLGHLRWATNVEFIH